MATRRRGSRRGAGGAAVRGRALLASLLAAGLAAALGAPRPSGAHPSPEEHADRAEARAACAASGSEAPDAVQLGARESALRERFGEVLEERPLRSEAGGGAAAEAAAAARAYEGQRRLVRERSEGDVREVAYDLYEGRVYRIRWRLAPRFEAPLADALAERARLCLGAPDFDQRVEPKLASGRDVVRRIGWREEERLLELRQLHPLTGGPVYLTVTDLAALRRLVAAGGSAAPDPESTGAWWRRPPKEVRVLPEEEREALVRAFARLLARVEPGGSAPRSLEPRAPARAAEAADAERPSP